MRALPHAVRAGTLSQRPCAQNGACMCYLWADAEVVPVRRTELLETLPDLNPSVALSSLAASAIAMCSSAH